MREELLEMSIFDYVKHVVEDNITDVFVSINSKKKYLEPGDIINMPGAEFEIDKFLVIGTYACTPDGSDLEEVNDGFFSIHTEEELENYILNYSLLALDNFYYDSYSNGVVVPGDGDPWIVGEYVAMIPNDSDYPAIIKYVTNDDRAIDIFNCGVAYDTIECTDDYGDEIKIEHPSNQDKLIYTLMCLGEQNNDFSSSNVMQPDVSGWCIESDWDQYLNDTSTKRLIRLSGENGRYGVLLEKEDGFPGSTTYYIVSSLVDIVQDCDKISDLMVAHCYIGDNYLCQMAKLIERIGDGDELLEAFNLVEVGEVKTVRRNQE